MVSSHQLPADLDALVRDELDPNERVLYAARPNAGSAVLMSFVAHVEALAVRRHGPPCAGVRGVGPARHRGPLVRRGRHRRAAADRAAGRLGLFARDATGMPAGFHSVPDARRAKDALRARAAPRDAEPEDDVWSGRQRRRVR